MRLPKNADMFVAALNDMLAEGKQETLQDSETLKAINRLLGAVAPEFCIVTVQSIEGTLLGFSAQQISVHNKPADSVSYQQNFRDA